MKPKNMILLVVAIGCGLTASYLTSQLLANREKTIPTIKVLVAKKRVAGYTLLKDPETWFVEKEFPENVAPKKAVTAFADAKDKRTNKVLNEETVLLADDLADAKSEGISATMGPGERAVAIRVNAEKSVAGFVLPGSRVDVVATVNTENVGKESKIILQNMLVLAVDTKDAKDPDQRSILGQTVTLAAKPEEAQRLALASTLGELQLILRPFGDREISHIPASHARDLDHPIEGGSSEAKEEAPPTQVATSLVPKLPPVIAAKEEDKKDPTPEPVVKRPSYEIHTILITNGENQQKAIYTREQGGKDWKHGQIGRVPDEAQEEAGSEQPAKPAPRAPAPPPARSQATKAGD
jgi:Flp pilus assembly protein CpaB